MMNMKTILALIMGAFVSQAALADGSNYVKLPDYNPNADAPAPVYSDNSNNQDSYGDDSYGADTDSEAPSNNSDDSSSYGNKTYDNEAPQNYVESTQDQSYSSNDSWGQVKAACDKRENDPYRISGQLSQLRIQIICTQYSSIDARIQAKGMETYSIKSQAVRAHSWKKDVLCENLVQSGWDLNVLCSPSNDTSNSDENYDNNQTYQDTKGQGS